MKPKILHGRTNAGQTGAEGDVSWVKQHSKRHDAGLKSNGAVPDKPYKGYRGPNQGQGSGAPNVKVA